MKKSQYRAQVKYDAKYTRQVHLKLNIKTDADVLEKLDSVPNVQGYIKHLIRKDMGVVDNFVDNAPAKP